MKVLMSADTVGGVYTYALELSAALRRHEVDVELVTFGRRPTPDQRHRAQRAGIQALHESELALEWMPDPWEDLRRAQELLLELEGQVRPDLVHLNAYAHGAAPFAAPVLIVGHSCVCSWWEAVHGEPAPAQWNPYRAHVRRGIAGADAVVAPSAHMLAALHRHHGPLPDFARVVHNGVAAPSRGAGGAAKEPFALAAGRFWDPAKGLDTLLEAANSRCLRGRVVVAGEGAEPGGAAGARLVGQLPPHRLASLRRRARVFVAPARYEPFGLGVLEAARDGCALVLGDIPSLRELWSEAARFVAPGDPERLAAAAGRLLDDPARAAALGRAARERSERLTATAMAAGYVALYRRLQPRAVAA